MRSAKERQAPSGGRESQVLRRVLAPAALRAGVGRVRTHDLRHTAGDLWLKNGATMEDVKATLGHSSFAITMDVYGHRDEDDSQSIRDAMDRAHWGVSSQLLPRRDDAEQRVGP